MSKYSENIPESIIGAIGWFYGDIPHNAAVLDFGCSTGYYGSYIRKNKNCAVYGVEISDDQEEAKKVLDGVYSFDLDGDWPAEVYERKYDVVFFGDVIEHLKDPEDALKKTKKLLKKNGTVFVSTPNVAHTSVRLELLGGGFEYESMGILDNTHLKYFTLQSLKRLAASSGYDIIRIDSSESDYPKEIVEEILNKYGLEPNVKFWKMISEPTARAFQYKLVLKHPKKGEKKRPTPSPVKKPEQYKKDFIQNLYDEIEHVKTELAKARTEAIQAKVTAIEHEKNSEILREALEDIRNSQTYKLAQKLSAAKNKLRMVKK